MKIGARTGILGLGLGLMLSASDASAHAAATRALVMLLPTDIYTAFGVGAVILTIALTALVPPAVFRALFGTERIEAKPASASGLSLASFALLAALITLGLTGPRDPLENLLPLTVFSVWWIFLPLVQASMGDIWLRLNPWSGLVALVFPKQPPFTIPKAWGVWPALATFALAEAYMITDIAPVDPARLAIVLGIYWLGTFFLCGIFGPEWLARGEGLTVFLSLMARLSPLKRGAWPAFVGHRIVNGAAIPVSLGIFALSMLALGSFDGLNGTFWWLNTIGINPLAFPGRSAVIWSNRAGMIGAIIALTLIFALAVRLGLELIGRGRDFSQIFPSLALTVLPIALGYHLAHFLTGALVNVQYFVFALDDPLQSGASLLGFSNHYVTTSFFNQRHTVETIWLVQAGAIVLAHMAAVILSHAVALRRFGSHKAAVMSQMPVAAFMVAYTIFGLWLLASPVAF